MAILHLEEHCEKPFVAPKGRFAVELVDWEDFDEVVDIFVVSKVCETS